MCHIDDNNNGGKVPEEIESPTGSRGNFTWLIHDCSRVLAATHVATQHHAFWFFSPIVNNRVTSVGWNESGFSMTTQLFQSVLNTCRLRVFPSNIFRQNCFSFPLNHSSIPNLKINLTFITIFWITTFRFIHCTDFSIYLRCISD